MNTDLQSRLAGVRFETFGGRRRMFAEWMELLAQRGVLDTEFLPPSTAEFLDAHYSVDVPYHNVVHIPPMLLAAHVLQDRIPIAARLAAVGHDAGHNGIKEESPESLSAQYTAEWLETEQDWLDRHNVDVAEVLEAISGTIYPYDQRDASVATRWMRWLDTARVASGSTAAHLDLDGVDAVLLMFVESLPLRLEDGVDLLELLEGRVDGFLCTVRDDINSKAIYPESADVEAVNDMRDAVRPWAAEERATGRLTGLDEFLCGDVTLREAADFWDQLVSE